MGTATFSDDFKRQIVELRNQANACMTRRSQGIPCGSGTS